LVYPAAFLYVNTRGVVAERWGHRDLFGRHGITETELTLMDSARTRVFTCGLKQSSASFIGLDMPGMNEVQEVAGEFLGDCLRVLQPRAASTLLLNVRALMPRDAFEPTLDLLRAKLVGQHALDSVPYREAVFSDLSVTLQHQVDGIQCDTAFGPMRRSELAQHFVDPDKPVGDEFPESFIFVQRVLTYQNIGVHAPKKSQVWRTAADRMREFLRRYGASAMTDLETYVAALLGEQAAGVL
jgi:hypothetical protein